MFGQAVEKNIFILSELKGWLVSSIILAPGVAVIILELSKSNWVTVSPQTSLKRPAGRLKESWRRQTKYLVHHFKIFSKTVQNIINIYIYNIYNK